VKARRGRFVPRPMMTYLSSPARTCAFRVFKDDNSLAAASFGVWSLVMACNLRSAPSGRRPRYAPKHQLPDGGCAAFQTHGCRVLIERIKKLAFDLNHDAPGRGLCCTCLRFAPCITVGRVVTHQWPRTITIDTIDAHPISPPNQAQCCEGLCKLSNWNSHKLLKLHKKLFLRAFHHRIGARRYADR
jgi:hypothetical protein